jgi:WXG100 family type VII secretion target
MTSPVVHSGVRRRDLSYEPSIVGGMPSNAISVTPAQLESLSGSVAQVSVEVRAQQQRLHGQLLPLFGAEWAGLAATQFAALYEQFESHARGLSDALEGIGQLLGRAGAAYAEVEQQIAASFR